jgi:hypothetical protein
LGCGLRQGRAHRKCCYFTEGNAVHCTESQGWPPPLLFFGRIFGMSELREGCGCKILIPEI